MPQKQQQQQQSHRQQHPQLLLDDEPAVIIFSDELNHASLVDGARLASRANGGGVVLRVFRHADLGHLEQLLRGAPPQARKLVLTDSLFSMDGDWADLQVWGARKEERNALSKVHLAGSLHSLLISLHSLDSQQRCAR